MAERRKRDAVVGAGEITSLLKRLARVPAVDPQAAFRAGQVVGRFVIVREIGRGGFGVVYEARDEELHRPVALKMMAPRATLDLGRGRMREAETAARLSHPNIVTLHDIGECDGSIYLVLELLRGRTLKQRLAEGNLPVREALHIAAEVAKGLAHAHAQGVVHRDLKPANVFLCEDGQVKLLDFGLAHVVGHRKVEGGTRGYMAPEQARGAPEDERTDVFALGVILFEMLSGQRPAADVALLARRGAALDSPELGGLAALVHRMLRKDPVKRPRDAAEVLAALTVLRDGPGPAPPPRTLPAGVRARHRSRRLSAPSTIAVLPFSNASAGAEEEYFSDGLSDDILNALAHVEGLRVTGRTSSFSFKGKNEDLRAIGRALDVRMVLEGSVRRSGDRVRISARLIDVEDGLHVWANTYDRELTDVFAVQCEISQSVAAAVGDALLPRRALGRRPASVNAYGQFLLGRYLHNRGSQDDLRAAIPAYERAIALDQGYAPAHAALSVACVSFALAIGSESGEDVASRLRRALDEANAAIALAPRLADGHAARGWARITGSWDWPGARADLERALALKPGDAFATLRLGHLLAVLGQIPQAIEFTRRALEMDPLDAMGWTHLAMYESGRGATGAARIAVGRALEIAPEHTIAAATLTRIHLVERDPAAALAVAERSGAEWVRLLGTALASHDLGRDAESRRALAALVERFARDAAWEVALIHAWRRDADRAFEWLARACDQRDPGLRHAKMDPLLLPVRGDPRYAALLKRMGLPVE